MRGNITAKVPGRVYELRVSLGRDPATGKYRQKSLTVRGPRAEAERTLRRLVEEVEAGRARTVDPTLTLGTLLDEWLAFTEALGRSPTTVERYRNVIQHQLKPALGDVPLGLLTTKAFDDLIPRPRRASAAIDGPEGSSCCPGRARPGAEVGLDRSEPSRRRHATVGSTIRDHHAESRSTGQAVGRSGDRRPGVRGVSATRRGDGSEARRAVRAALA
jgi:Phage integrase, N-terminal SAM-like domain